LWHWLVPAAHAASQSPAETLRGMLPRLPGLNDYLGVVSALLEEATLAHLKEDTRLPAEYHDMLEPLVRATAWKETCWRHYLDNADPPKVIRSAVGAVGMMQINVRVWRGLYDMERLEADVAYNVNAGIRILEHYLLDYAIRRGEHEHPGGVDNLVRATYAAYNGGPGQMPRYRSDKTPERLRQIDQAFWRAYERMKKDRWPDVSTCYPV
jgi:soluble lytic murein transglycosylase-like protein